MAPLPNTNITTTLVGQTLGTSSRDVGTLFLHPNVNEWGFDCPGINNMKAVWGKPPSERQKLSPNDPNYTPVFGVIPGYNLGYFRGYDHNWVAYSMIIGAFERSGYTSMETTIGLVRPPKLIAKPNPYPNFFIDFTVEFARIVNDFDKGTATMVDNNAFASEDAPYTLTIDGKYPPDKATNGILAEGATFYIKITPINVPDRRLIDVGPFILSSTMVADTTPAQVLGVRNFFISAVKGDMINSYTISATIYANYSAGVVSVTGIMSNSSDFSSYDTIDGMKDVSLTLSGTEYTASVIFDFTAFMANITVKGDTVYGRISLTNGAQSSGSAVVDDLPPRE